MSADIEIRITEKQQLKFGNLSLITTSKSISYRKSSQIIILSTTTYTSLMNCIVQGRVFSKWGPEIQTRYTHSVKWG